VELYPAIDIRAGRVVRVRRGDPGSEVVYHHDPLAVAEAYARDGARWIHVVDLDRVFGAGDQTALISDLVRRVALRWQAGGGVTTAAEAERLFGCGIARVIVRPGPQGAAGLEGLARDCGGSHLALALVVADRPAGGAGRGEGRDAEALDRTQAVALAGAAAAAGIGTVVYTDLGLEGRLGGADVAGAAALARAAGVAVVVSGGVQSLEEISRIRAAGLAGAVVGRALYEGRFTLREALACSSP
jgi:phosphoribosylformimino-5-aminoimidazole carboxamide ribonucleotide (ProFAR) isomerase